MQSMSRLAIALVLWSGAQTDRVRIVVTNNMPHPMLISYDADGGRQSLGAVDGGAERTLTISGFRGDSVRVWATNEDPPHQLSRMFPTHTSAVLSWAF